MTTKSEFSEPKSTVSDFFKSQTLADDLAKQGLRWNEETKRAEPITSSSSTSSPSTVDAVTSVRESIYAEPATLQPNSAVIQSSSQQPDAIYAVVNKPPKIASANSDNIPFHDKPKFIQTLAERGMRWNHETESVEYINAAANEATKELQRPSTFHDVKAFWEKSTDPDTSSVRGITSSTQNDSAVVIARAEQTVKQRASQLVIPVSSPKLKNQNYSDKS